jgi:shikimate kinase
MSSVVLIGYRGSGKTTIGRRLADRLWQSFVDTDDRIVARAGKPICEIFSQDGEAAFRDMETDALDEVLALDDHVIAVGGGAVEREQNRALLQQSGLKVIYLRCEPAVLLARITADAASEANRPALTDLGGGLDEIQQVLARREPLYRQVMTGELDVTRLTPDEALVYITRQM